MPIAYDFIAIFPLAKWPHQSTGESEATIPKQSPVERQDLEIVFWTIHSNTAPSGEVRFKNYFLKDVG